VIRVPRPAGGPVALLWAVLVLATPGPGAAHAIVLESSPGQDATLARPPEQVTLRFNIKIEKRFTRLTLSVGDRPPVAIALLDLDGASPPDRLVIPLRPLAPGVYVLRYRVLAVDGHVTEGALRFTVGPGR
jgi:copper resistance protein C